MGLLHTSLLRGVFLQHIFDVNVYEESPVACVDDDIESGRELSETDRLVPKLKILLF